ncbi:hypothetical protein E2C01_058306 [Portunus trituberculatus]|uniref:Uncharacterized protein n=1 Tax=Portunus trituberculatus TaxID=210409 RepID=A0A5B7H3D4_PORTR|nr:hypothetical protein [Portunus trituberculatus]
MANTTTSITNIKTTAAPRKASSLPSSPSFKSPSTTKETPKPFKTSEGKIDLVNPTAARRGVLPQVTPVLPPTATPITPTASTPVTTSAPYSAPQTTQKGTVPAGPPPISYPLTLTPSTPRIYFTPFPEL